MSRDLLALSLCGCQSPPELTWQGEHVRLGAEQPEAICGGTREYLDRRAGELKARFEHRRTRIRAGVGVRGPS